MPTFKEKKDAADTAGSKYEDLKNRQKKHTFLSGEENKEQKKAFLWTHVDIAAAYAGDPSFSSNRVKPETAAFLLDEQQYIPDFHTMYLQQIGAPANAQGAQQQGAPVNAQGAQQQGAPVNAQAPVQQPRNFSEQLSVNAREEEQGTVQSLQIKQGLDQGINGSQKEGLRKIGIWLYKYANHGTFKDHTLFVDSFMAKSAREKLLSYYLIEKDCLHAPNTNDVILSQVGYIPNVEAFEQRMLRKKRKGRGFYRFFYGNDVYWDKLSDAGMTAKSCRPLLGKIGAVGPANQPQNAGGGAAAANQNYQGMNSDQLLGEISSIGIALIQFIGQDDLTNAQAIHLLTNLRLALDEFNNVITAQGASPADAALNDTGENDQDIPGSSLDAKIFKHSTNVQKLLGISKTALADVATAQKVIQLYKAAYYPKEGADKRNFYHDLDKIKPKEARRINNYAVPWFSLGQTVMSVINLVTLCTSFGWKASNKGDMAKAVMSLCNISFGGLSNTYSTVRGFASFANAAWAAKDAAVNASAGLSIVTGAVSMGFAIADMSISGYQLHKTNKTRQSIEADINQSPQMLPASDKQRVIASAAAARGRRLHHKMGSAGIQLVQGFLQAGSGVLALSALATFGVAGVAAVLVGAAAAGLGIFSMIYQWYGNRKDRRATIDDFVGMEQLYQNAIRNDPSLAQKSKDSVKKMLRERAIAVMGFSSEEKLYSHIMMFYAETYYRMAFIDETTGTFVQNLPALVAAAYDKPAPVNAQGAPQPAAPANAPAAPLPAAPALSAQDQQRVKVLKLIRGLGLKLGLDQNNQPTVSVNTIYKQMMQ